ncbi:uncharacterized protein RCH25_037991 [Pelodytes ibericus]
MSQLKIQEYKQYIQSYSLGNSPFGNQGYTRVLLQLFGLPGNGKSSFINSCKFVLDDVYKAHAEAAASDGGCTTMRLPYDLTSVITMVDNRGCPTLSKSETGEIFAQLANLLPLNQEVEWGTDYNTNVERIMKVESECNYTDFIIPIFVHSVKNAIGRAEINMYKEMLNTARKLTGINPIIVLTHKSHGRLTETCTMFRDTGFDKIYAIENYTMEDHQKVLGKHEEILNFLRQVLKEVDFCMEIERNPGQDRINRMKFILKYIKEIDDDKKKEDIEKKEQQREWERERERERERNRGFFSRLFNW